MIFGFLRSSSLAEALGRNAKPDPTVEGDNDVDQTRMTETEKKEIERKREQERVEEANWRRIKLKG
jgi:hypothetical protein